MGQNMKYAKADQRFRVIILTGPMCSLSEQAARGESSKFQIMRPMSVLGNDYVPISDKSSDLPISQNRITDIGTSNFRYR